MLQTSKIVGFTATTRPDEARNFYGDILGLQLLEETPFAIVFDANGTTVLIQKVESVQAPVYTLLGWEVDDIADVVKQLGERGVKFERYDGLEQDEFGIWHSPGGTKVAWFKDPDGNLLSLSESA